MAVPYVDLTFIPENTIGEFSISHFKISPKEIEHLRIDDAIHGEREWSGISPDVTYTRLKYGDTVVMSNTPMEMNTNFVFIHHCSGKVMVGGLGIGMILIAIANRMHVEHLTVVERSPEVIMLVWPHIVGKLKFPAVCQLGDVDTYRDARFKKPYPRMFDWIYFDIWSAPCGDNWEQYKKLKRLYMPLLKKDGTIDAWRMERCRRLAQEERAWIRQLEVTNAILRRSQEERKVSNGNIR